MNEFKSIIVPVDFHQHTEEIADFVGFLQLPFYTGGADETRTRDLRRDRPAF